MYFQVVSLLYAWVVEKLLFGHSLYVEKYWYLHSATCSSWHFVISPVNDKTNQNLTVLGEGSNLSLLKAVELN